MTACTTSSGANRTLGLMRFVLGSPGILEVEQAVADALVRAMEIILEMVSVEQKFAILMENFLELEQEIASSVLRDAYFSAQLAQDFFDVKQAFNRRTMNILAAARLYRDQAGSHVKVFFPCDNARWEELEACFSRQYDDNLSYRVMDALRNHAQHRGLPIHGLTMGSRWLDAQQPTARLEFNAAINILVRELEDDPKFKKSVLKELRSVANEKGAIDIRPMIKTYVQSLAIVHEHFRSMTDPELTQAFNLVEEWSAKYVAACPSKDKSSAAVGWQYADGRRERIAYLNDEQIAQLKTLRARTRSNVNLAQRFITTMPYER